MDTVRDTNTRHETPAGGEGLLFCAVCRVSVPRDEIERRDARRTRRGGVYCAACAVATPEERLRRREQIEAEFADDAPVLVPFKRADDETASAVAPRARTIEDEILERRVGELERSVFRLSARIAALESRLEESLRRSAQ